MYMTRALGICSSRLQVFKFAYSSVRPFCPPHRLATCGMPTYFAATAAASSFAAVAGSTAGVDDGTGSAGLSTPDSVLTGAAPEGLEGLWKEWGHLRRTSGSYWLTRGWGGGSIGLCRSGKLSCCASLIGCFCLGACRCRRPWLFLALTAEDSFKLVHDVECWEG